MEIKDLRINHMDRPLGFRLFGRPVASWRASSEVSEKQASYRVRAALGEDMSRPVYDSGPIESDSFLHEMNMELSPRTRYYFTVEARGDGGDFAFAASWFETGKMGEEWQGGWIGLEDGADIPVPRFYKSFTAPGEIKSARAYIACAGLYRLCLNGVKAGNEHLTPYCNTYSSWMQIITHDVGHILCGGENQIEVTLANGWYKGRFGLEGKENIFGGRLGLLFELHIEYSDGGSEIISSGEDWQAGNSFYEAAEIYDGEFIDFNQNTESRVRTQRLDIDKSLLTDRLSPPVTVHEELPVKEIITTPNGETCLDFGQNMGGWLRVDTNYFPDKDFRLYFFEVFDEKGNFYNDNLKDAKQMLSVKACGKGRIIEADFTFYGFRYVKAEGLDSIPAEAFTACAAHSQMEERGSIETSNHLVNRLFLNAMWGQKSNFIDVPTDCPQRSERLGWTGDAQVFCGTAYYNTDCAAFFDKYMYDIWQEQQLCDGMVPNFVPTFDTGEAGSFSKDYSSAWGDVVTVLGWTSYLHTGNKTMLERHYPGMKAWVDFIRSKDKGDFLWADGFHFGDWLALDNPNSRSYGGSTPLPLISSAYYLYSAELTAKAAKALGYMEDANFYSKLAENIKKALEKEFVTPSGRIASDTQTANVVALQMGFASNRKKAADMLAEKINSAGGKLTTGFVGTAYLCRVLSDNGHNSLAYKLLLNREYPGWLYEVDRGATTVWERWNSIMPDGSLGDVNMNSFNHYAYGAVVEWMYRNSAGIKPCENEPGFKKAIIAPRPDGGLKYLNAHLNTQYGLYKSGWEITEDSLVFRFEIPFNCTADIVLPHVPREVSINGKPAPYNGLLSLGAGEYEIIYKPLERYFIEYNLNSDAALIFGNAKLKKILTEIVPEVKSIPFFLLFSITGSISDFLEARGIGLSSEQEKRLIEQWKNIRSWDYC